MPAIILGLLVKQTKYITYTHSEAVCYNKSFLKESYTSTNLRLVYISNPIGLDII